MTKAKRAQGMKAYRDTINKHVRVIAKERDSLVKLQSEVEQYLGCINLGLEDMEEGLKMFDSGLESISEVL